MSVEYTPLKIYKNLEIFFKYRQLDLVYGNLSVDKGKIKSSSKKWLTDSEFISTIQFQGYVIVEAVDSETRKRRMKSYPPSIRKLPVTTIIIIFDDIEKYTKTQYYKQLIERLPHIQDSGNIEIITIARGEPSVFLRKAIASIERVDDPRGYIRIFSREYANYCSIIPLHVNAPKCRVVSSAEEEEIIRALYTDKSQLPRVFDSDGLIIWFPVEMGDIVEELHMSESVGYEKIYRVVVATPQIEK